MTRNKSSPAAVSQNAEGKGGLGHTYRALVARATHVVGPSEQEVKMPPWVGSDFCSPCPLPGQVKASETSWGENPGGERRLEKCLQREQGSREEPQTRRNFQALTPAPSSETAHLRPRRKGTLPRSFVVRSDGSTFVISGPESLSPLLSLFLAPSPNTRNTCTHAYTHTYAHTHIHLHVYAHTYTHTVKN